MCIDLTRAIGGPLPGLVMFDHNKHRVPNIAIAPSGTSLAIPAETTASSARRSLLLDLSSHADRLAEDAGLRQRADLQIVLEDIALSLRVRADDIASQRAGPLLIERIRASLERIERNLRSTGERGSHICISAT